MIIRFINTKSGKVSYEINGNMIPQTGEKYIIDFCGKISPRFVVIEVHRYISALLDEKNKATIYGREESIVKD